LKEGKNLNIAPMGTASFFWKATPHRFSKPVRCSLPEKDIVDSGLGCSDRYSTVLLLIIRIIILEK